MAPNCGVTGKLIRLSSASSFSGQDGWDCAGQNLKIRHDALLFDVVNVELHLARKINFAAAADLPKASNAGLNRKAAAVFEGILGDFAGDRRAGPDQRHIPNEHIVK